MKIMVETSARHLHVSQEALEALFGQGAKLTNKKDLSQPGQFACVEKVKVVGPRGDITMSILGPVRRATQVEVAFTDARKLGIAAPVRESGDIAGTPGCKLVARVELLRLPQESGYLPDPTNNVLIKVPIHSHPDYY